MLTIDISDVWYSKNFMKLDNIRMQIAFIFKLNLENGANIIILNQDFTAIIFVALNIFWYFVNFLYTKQILNYISVDFLKKI